MNAISPLVPSSRQYKIAGENLEAGIPDLREKYLSEKYRCEKHPHQNLPNENSTIEKPGSTINLKPTSIILHLIDAPVLRLEFTGKLPSVNRVDIDNERIDAGNHRFSSLKTNNPGLGYQSRLSSFTGRDQRLSAAIRCSA